MIVARTIDAPSGSRIRKNSGLPKIRRVRKMIDEIKPGCDLEVDGGIDATTAPLAVAAGANVLVAGTAIVDNSEGIAAAMQRLRGNK